MDSGKIVFLFCKMLNIFSKCKAVFIFLFLQMP